MVELPTRHLYHMDTLRQHLSPRCLSPDLNDIGDPRFHELTHALCETYSNKDLWDIFGVAPGIVVCL